MLDDGSADATSAVVRKAFDKDPRVSLMTFENGGKARALNRGLARARGDVVVALDADTLFPPDTLGRLARWFSDPRVGAVAGNALVGNRNNLITRWQALEYVTAQNLERRALAALGAVTVVPGAVGAWRAAALQELGGYPDDTLAEDQDLTIASSRRLAVEFDPARAPTPRRRDRAACSSSASAGRSAPCSACGSTARPCSTSSARCWASSPCRDLAVPDRADRGRAAGRPGDRLEPDLAYGSPTIRGVVARRPDPALEYWAAFIFLDLSAGASAWRWSAARPGATSSGCRSAVWLPPADVLCGGRVLDAALHGVRVGWGSWNAARPPPLKGLPASPARTHGASDAERFHFGAGVLAN